MKNAPTNTDDIIDSRDVIERIEELEAERSELGDALHDATTVRAKRAAKKALDAWNASDEARELKALVALASEAEGYAADWKHGECLIRESYFTEYCEQLLEDIGDLPKDIPNYIVIDWEATARNLKVDYTEVDFDGVTYLIR